MTCASSSLWSPSLSRSLAWLEAACAALAGSRSFASREPSGSVNGARVAGRGLSGLFLTGLDRLVGVCEGGKRPDIQNLGCGRLRPCMKGDGLKARAVRSGVRHIAGDGRRSCPGMLPVLLVWEWETRLDFDRRSLRGCCVGRGMRVCSCRGPDRECCLWGCAWRSLTLYGCSGRPIPSLGRGSTRPRRGKGRKEE